MTQQARTPIHAYVERRAADGWHGFAGMNRLTTTSLLDAIGSQLADVIVGKRTAIDLGQAIDAAADIAQARLNRRKDRTHV